MNLRIDFRLLKKFETVIDCETFEIGRNAFLYHDMATSLWGQGLGCVDLNKKVLPVGSYLNA